MNTITKQEVPVFGYEIIRDHVLSNILGKHESEILYWAGKDLARKFPLYSMEEAQQFFLEAGWGQLTLLKENKDEFTYVLTCLLYTSPSPRDISGSRMPSSA